jgi:MFS family permease
MSTAEAGARSIRSLIPARLDRLSWSPFHTRMVCGLGGAWILDGLQITVASSVTGELTKSSTLGRTSAQVGLIASVYLVGEMIGALVFGKMSDRLGANGSAGASAAHLTVSETWPIEIRAEAIAVFFAIGAVFGALGPAFYGALIGNGSSRTGLFWGYLIGAGIMLTGGLVEVFPGVQAAGKSLEQVTKPLTSVSEPASAAAAKVAGA